MTYLGLNIWDRVQYSWRAPETEFIVSDDDGIDSKYSLTFIDGAFKLVRCAVCLLILPRGQEICKSHPKAGHDDLYVQSYTSSIITTQHDAPEANLAPPAKRARTMKDSENQTDIVSEPTEMPEFQILIIIAKLHNGLDPDDNIRYSGVQMWSSDYNAMVASGDTSVLPDQSTWERLSSLSIIISSNMMYWAYTLVQRIEPVLYHFHDTPILWVNTDLSVAPTINRCWLAVSTSRYDSFEQITRVLNSMLHRPHRFAAQFFADDTSITMSPAMDPSRSPPTDVISTPTDLYNDEYVLPFVSSVLATQHDSGHVDFGAPEQRARTTNASENKTDTDFGSLESRS